MGTRSVIAIPTGDTWRGRYVHWDGYPSGVGAALTAILARDGYETAVRVLTEDYYGWSAVTGKTEDPCAEREPDRFVSVPGYGVAYTHAEQDDAWIESTGDDWGTEWAYVINRHGVLTFRRSYDKRGRKYDAWVPACPCDLAETECICGTS